MPYHWTIKPRTIIPENILELCAGDTLVARLLLNRGINSTTLAQYFIDSNKITPTHALEIPDMDKAIKRIITAIEKQEKIIVYGDYDVDGTSSVALLYRAFGIIGKEVEYYIPSRHKEGYGINIDAVKHMRTNLGASLMISCDCGISNYDEIAYAQSIGLDVIVTDHHSIPSKSPPSIANCNPKTLAPDHPLHWLPGVGVAYKLAELLLDQYLDTAEAKAYASSLLDLVALGMVADLAPLLAENRYLTVKGLKMLAKTSKPGLVELLRVSGVHLDPNAEHIGFGLAPRINAAGRLSEADKAVRLMITEDREEARILAEELDTDNKERQVLCQSTFEEALEMIQNEPSMLDDNCIVLASASWHHGIIGIVASKILDRFHLPVFIIAVDDDKARASARSINIAGLDIYEEMCQIQSETGLFAKFGGHKMAAGFSVSKENLNELINRIRAHFKNKLRDADLCKVMKIDAAIKLVELNEGFFARIAKLAPYGIENPSPLFAVDGALVEQMKFIGKDSKHLKLYIKEENSKRCYEAVLWNRAEEFLETYNFDSKFRISLVFSPKINEFNGDKLIQLDIRDWQSPERVDPQVFNRFALAQ